MAMPPGTAPKPPRLPRILPPPWLLLLLLLASLPLTAAESSGDEFSNNLFSDLAPLLALFGEQVAKQFMSESLGMSDSIIFACAPLGIITAVVGAIRVGGPTWLKAIIGRARENRATAEVELMTSTSRETCELWNGSQIVRVMGSPGVAELIYVVGEGGFKLYNLEEAKREGILEEVDPVQRVKREGKSHMSGDKDDDEEWAGSTRASKKKGIVPPAPNISLNIHQQRSRTELRVVAVIGVVVQLSVFAFSAWSLYFHTWTMKGDRPVASYAFPLFTMGTTTLCIGMLICSYIIESGSKETRYRVTGPPVYLLWVQRQQPVSDQHFDSYAIFAKGKRNMIITSHPNEQHFRGPDATSILSSELWAVIGTAVSLSGFICQFVGLRGMHFSASIAQLTATIIMAILRAWVRRGLSERPLTAKLPPGHELDWLSTKLVHDAEDLWGKPHLSHQSSSLKSFLTTPMRRNTKAHEDSPMKNALAEEDKEYFRWESAGYLDSSGKNLAFKRDMISSSRAQRVLQVRRRLGALTGWSGAGSDAASSLGRAIGRVLDHLKLEGDGPLYWPVNTGANQQVEFAIEQSAMGYWNINRWDLEAALSLRLFGMRDRERQWQNLIARLDNTEEGNSLRILSRLQYSVKKVNLQLLVVNAEHSLREFQWWLGDSYRRLLLVWRDPEKRLFEIPEHRVVGARLLQGSSNHQFYWDNALSDPDDDDPSTPGLRNRQLAFGIMSDAPLEVLYAREFLLAFVWVAAESSAFVWADEQAKVSPRKVLRTAGNEDQQSEPFSFTLECTSLTKMVEQIEETGLGSFVEVHTIVVAPLLSKGLLPEMTVVVEFAREKSRPFEIAGKWEEAGKILKEMFRACMRAKTSKPVKAKATAAFVEFFRTVSIATDLQVEQKGDKVEKMEALRKELIELLGMVKPGFLNTLAKMYELQGRGPRVDPKKSLLEAKWEVFQLRIPTGDRAQNLAKALMDNPQTGFTAIHERASITQRKRTSPPHTPLKFRDLPLSALTAKDILGWTPLHYATLRGDEESVTTLLSLGASPTTPDLSEWTPLHYAALTRDVSLAWSLLQHGISVNTPTRTGLTPLHISAMTSNLETLSLLIESGADLNPQDTTHRTPLHHAAHHGHRPACSLLTEKGATLTPRDLSGLTPTHLSALTGEPSCLALLLDHHVDPNGKDRAGRTPLHIAIEHGQRSCVKLLLNRSVHLEARDRTGYTPLYTAVKHGHDGIVQLLLEAGAMPERRGNDGKNWWSPIQLAAVLGHTNIGRILLKHGARVGSLDGLARSPLHHAAGRGHLGFVQMLVRRRAWVNARDKFGRTPLEYALYRKNMEVAEWLRKHGAVVEVKEGEEEGGEGGEWGVLSDIELSDEALEGLGVHRRDLWMDVAKTTFVKPGEGEVMTAEKDNENGG